jgi:hypothetical protein
MAKSFGSCLIAFFILNLTANSAFSAPAFKHRAIIRLDESKDEVPAVKTFIENKNPIIPFHQWNENNGYCGEVSFIEANLNQGQWISEYNVRLLCGSGLSQTGPDGFCAAHQGQANYNAQFLLENPVAGDQAYDNAPQCLRNAHLAFQTYDYSRAAAGMDGYKQYLAWIKSQVIAGNQVTIAILNFGGTDPEYDHEVTVTQIGTNHDQNDPSYYDDDVLFFEDHGSGGTPYTDGYTFGSLAKSRAGANLPPAHSYSILIPGAYPVFSSTGGDGAHTNPRPITASNFAFSVSGIVDPNQETLPVVLSITGSSIAGIANKPDPVDGFNFENPEVGGGNEDACTNTPPASWMVMSLQASVRKLIPGVNYNLYEYDFTNLSGIGDAAALRIPDSNFNAQSILATKTTSFVATASTYSQTIQITSDQVIAFRCVRADAP